MTMVRAELNAWQYILVNNIIDISQEPAADSSSTLSPTTIVLPSTIAASTAASTTYSYEILEDQLNNNLEATTVSYSTTVQPLYQTTTITEGGGIDGSGSGIAEKETLYEYFLNYAVYSSL